MGTKDLEMKQLIQIAYILIIENWKLKGLHLFIKITGINVFPYFMKYYLKFYYLKLLASWS